MTAEVFMSFPVFVHQDNGHFVATLIGAPEVRVTAPTREGAIAQMQVALDRRHAAGELVFLEVSTRKGVSAIAGKYRDDPTLKDIREEIYRERDAEPKE
jgi:hypothetical protein